MTMTVQLIGLDDPRWGAALGKVSHDVFHIPEYLRVEDGFRGTHTRLLLVEEGAWVLLLPLVFSPLVDGRSDASSPYGYSGPEFTATAPASWRRRAVRAALEELGRLGVVSLFLRGHPTAGLAEFADDGILIEHGPVYVIPLDRPVDEIQAGMRSNHRRNIRKAARDGYVAERDPDWQHLEAFCEIYGATMDRLQARADYRFNLQYFEGLRDQLGPRASLWVLRMDGVIAGGHVVTEVDGTVEYLLGATHPRFYRKAPQVAIFEAVLELALVRGDTEYVLGGGASELLLHFKAGFTNVHVPFSTGRLIIDAEGYEQQCESWAAVGHADPGEGYFPVYRAPGLLQAGA